jgi:hypothetical protein
MRRETLWWKTEAPKDDQYGIKATTRFGLGILRSNAIAKMTNIKTTLTQPSSKQTFFLSSKDETSHHIFYHIM